MCQVTMWSTHTTRLVEPQGLKTWHNFNEGGQEVKAVMETPEHLYNETEFFCLESKYSNSFALHYLPILHEFSLASLLFDLAADCS